MLAKFLADENFRFAIVQGLLRQRPIIDIVRVQEIGLTGEHDPLILKWAAQQKRILLTHDVNTMIKFAYERLEAGLPMPGMIVSSQSASIGRVIEDILLLSKFEDEWEGQIHYVPLS